MGPRPPDTTSRPAVRSPGYPRSTISPYSMVPMAITVAGAEPDRAAKNAQAKTSARPIPPRTLPTKQFANFTMRREMPPFVIRLPARTKNAMAMMEVDCRPPKIRCAMTVEDAPRSPSITALREAVPRDTDTGTPMIRHTTNTPNRITAAFIHLPPFS